MTTKLNVGPIVAGRIGRVHAENLRYRIPEANLIAVSDILPEAAGKLGTDYQIPSHLKTRLRPLLRQLCKIPNLW